MDGRVQASAAKIETDLRRRRPSEPFLRGHRITAFEDRQIGPAAAVGDLGHQRHQGRSQTGQRRGDLRRDFARLEIIQQRVIRSLDKPDGRGLLPLQPIDLVQVGAKRRVIVIAASFRPNVLRQRSGVRQFFDQRLRQLAPLVELAF